MAENIKLCFDCQFLQRLYNWSTCGYPGYLGLPCHPDMRGKDCPCGPEATFYKVFTTPPANQSFQEKKQVPEKEKLDAGLGGGLNQGTE